MDEQISYVTKMGKRLVINIPSKSRIFGKGDKVKIDIVEKGMELDPARLKQQIKNYIANPNGERINVKIMGFNLKIPMAKLIRHMTPKKAEAFLFELIMEA